jgi:hypothetical protein
MQNFEKNDVPNLLSRKLNVIVRHLLETGVTKFSTFPVCPSHRAQYIEGAFVLVPAPDARATLINYEIENFKYRQYAVADGTRDPGRMIPDVCCSPLYNFTSLISLVKVPNEVEYIPVHSSWFLACIHNVTPFDPTLFVFDNRDTHPCPILHFRVSPIALLMRADGLLGLHSAFSNDRTNRASSECWQLLDLYSRKLTPSQPPWFAAMPANIGSFSSTMDPFESSQHAISPSPIAPAHEDAPTAMSNDPDSLGLDAPSPRSTFPTHDEVPSTQEMYESSDDGNELSQYEEPVVTLEDIRKRPHIPPPSEDEFWRFSSSDEASRGPW